MSRRNHNVRRRNASNVVVTNDVVDHSQHIDDASRDVIDDVHRQHDVNAIDALNVVTQTQRNDERETHIAKLLHALYNDESLSSHDKKTIRRTLRDTYDYYISRERRRNASNVVASILSRDAS